MVGNLTGTGKRKPCSLFCRARRNAYGSSPVCRVQPSGACTPSLTFTLTFKILTFSKTFGYPGQPSYTRGIHPTMYRRRLWTIREFSGFGTSEDTNARLHYY
ncbi:MAG: hypothetical protein EXQ58_05315 [Acidobacteria bacterium]|nr:hypothetical protein [Acidobacteriota bacterium]